MPVFCQKHHPEQIEMRAIMTNYWGEKGGKLVLYECPECGHKFGRWEETEPYSKKNYK